MSFPITPSNGDTYKNYIYNNITLAWTKMEGGIKESGSNSSGNWIWMYDGTLIQWGSFNQSTGTMSRGSNGSSAYEPYYSSVNLQFPTAFEDISYAISFSAGFGTSNYPIEAGYQTTGRTTTRCPVSIQSNYPYHDQVMHCSFMAIGKK